MVFISTVPSKERSVYILGCILWLMFNLLIRLFSFHKKEQELQKVKEEISNREDEITKREKLIIQKKKNGDEE